MRNRSAESETPRLPSSASRSGVGRVARRDAPSRARCSRGPTVRIRLPLAESQAGTWALVQLKGSPEVRIPPSPSPPHRFGWPPLIGLAGPHAFADDHGPLRGGV